MVFYDGGSSSGWSFTVSVGCSFIRVVYHQGGLSLALIIRVVFHWFQSHQDDISSEQYLIWVVFQQFQWNFSEGFHGKCNAK